MKKGTQSFLKYLDEETSIAIDWSNIEPTEYIQLNSETIEKDIVYMTQGNLKLIIYTCGLKTCSEIIAIEIIHGLVNNDLTIAANVMCQIMKVAPGIPIVMEKRVKLNSSTNYQIMCHWSKHDCYSSLAFIPTDSELREVKSKKEILSIESEELFFTDEMDDLDIDPCDQEDEIELDVYNFNPWANYYLRDFFGLLSDKEVTQKIRENEDCYSSSIGYEDFSDLELLYEEYEKDLKMLRDMEFQHYFSEIKVLLVYNYPCYQAFSIGETIAECKYIGLSIYGNDIWGIIEYHLQTGECDLHW